MTRCPSNFTCMTTFPCYTHNKLSMLLYSVQYMHDNMFLLHAPATRMITGPCNVHDKMFLLHAPAIRMTTYPCCMHMSLLHTPATHMTSCPCYLHGKMFMHHAWRHAPATRMTTFPCYTHDNMSLLRVYAWQDVPSPEHENCVFGPALLA